MGKLEKVHSMLRWPYTKTTLSPRLQTQTMKLQFQIISMLVSVVTILVILVILLLPKIVGSLQMMTSITPSDTMLLLMAVRTQMMLTMYWSLKMELVIKPDSVLHHSNSLDRRLDNLSTDIVKSIFAIQMLSHVRHHVTEAVNDVMQMTIPQHMLSLLV